jgi:carboxypeptidase family protein/TonB-dependent receptor-like protein
MRLRTLAALLAVVLLAWPAAAQEQRGSIEGVVKDASGAVLPGVTVTLTGGSGIKLDAVSEADGLYRFPSLQPGTYTVMANLQGFNPGKVSDIIVQLGQIKKVDFSLAVAGVAETVQVTAESPLVDVKQGSHTTNISAERVQLIPHNRDFTSLVTQAPGANNEPKSGGIMIDGSAAAENRYIIDGIETTDLVHGQSGKNLISDFVEEVQVKSSGYSAEFGGSTGGVINVLTKSGSNEFHGSALTYWQGDKVQGAPNQSLRLLLTDNTKAEYQTYGKDQFNRYEPGAQIGGPIFQNRAWFFGAYQPASTKTTRTVAAGTDGQVGTSGNPKGTPSVTVRKEQVQYLSANQTAQLGSKLRTRLAFNNSWSKSEGQLASVVGTDSPTTPYTKGTKFPNWSLSGTADYVVSSKMFLGFRAGRYLNDTHDVNVPDVVRFSFSTSNLGMAGVPADLQHANGFSNVPSNSAVIRDAQTRNYIQADATYYARLGGDHQIKGGVQVDRRAEDILSGEQENLITLTWTADGSGCPYLPAGPFGCYELRSNAPFPRQGFVTQGNVKSNVNGVFVQDAWTVTNKLTINAGIRTENENVPAYTVNASTPASPIKFGFGDKIAPRANFAYDVKGDGLWKVSGSWGVFYDIFKLELPQGSFGGQKWLSYYYTLDTANYTTLRDGANCPPACSGTILNNGNPVDFRAVSVTPGLDVDPNLKPMRSQEASFVLEHQLNNVSSISARYVHKQLDRGIDDTGDLDPLTGSEFYIISNPGEGLTKNFDISTGASLFSPQGFTSSPQIITNQKARRVYNAVEVAYNKRLQNNWSFYGTYTISRDHGNYAGLSQSDENGRSDPNVGRSFDYPAMSFDGKGNPIDGPLPTDRTHQVKLQGLYMAKWGTSVGINEYVASGVPLSTAVSIISGHSYPIYPFGRGDLGRTPMFSQTDLLVQHSFRVSGDKKIQLEMTVLNLFNQRTVLDKGVNADRVNRTGAIPLAPGFYTEAAFYNHQLDFNQLIQSAFAAGRMTADPRFNQPSSFQTPLQARFGVKFTF